MEARKSCLASNSSRRRAATGIHGSWLENVIGLHDALTRDTPKCEIPPMANLKLKKGQALEGPAKATPSCFLSPFSRLDSIESTVTSPSSDEDISIGSLARKQRTSFLVNMLPTSTSSKCWSNHNTKDHQRHWSNMTNTRGSATRWKEEVAEINLPNSGYTQQSKSSFARRANRHKYDDQASANTNMNKISFNHWLDMRMANASNTSHGNKDSEVIKHPSCKNVSSDVTKIEDNDKHLSSYAQALKHGSVCANKKDDNHLLPVADAHTQNVHKFTKRKCLPQSQQFQSHKHINKLLFDRDSESVGNSTSKPMSVLQKGMGQTEEKKQYDRQDKLQYKKLFEERHAFMDSIKNQSSSKQASLAMGSKSQSGSNTESNRAPDADGDERATKNFHIDLRFNPSDENLAKRGQSGSADFTITFLDHKKTDGKDGSSSSSVSHESANSESCRSSNTKEHSEEPYSLTGSVHFILNGSDTGASDQSDDDYDSWSSDDDDETEQGASFDDQMLLTVFSHSVPLLSDSLPGLRKVASAPELTRLQKLNRKWNQCYDEVEEAIGNDGHSLHSGNKKCVHFPADSRQLEQVHHMVAWRHAYQAARKGPWEEMARDRGRFMRRVHEVERVISPFLSSDHRQKVYAERMERMSVT